MANSPTKFGPILGIKKLSKTIKDKDTQIILDNLENGLVGLQNTVLTNLSGLQLLHVPRLLTGSGTTQLTKGTTVVYLTGVGQGGGGGGVQDTGLGIAAGSGGSSGTVLKLWIGDIGKPLTTLSITFTAGSSAGAGGAAGANGQNGADSIIKINNSSYTIKGGAGGVGLATGIAASGNTNPVAPTIQTYPGAIVTYGLGDPGELIAGVAWFSGNGGMSEFGAGGVLVGGNNNGNPGQLYGGGGSGASTSGLNGNKTGGSGAAGVFMLWELG